MFQRENIEFLKSKGLKISGNEKDRISVIKPKGLSGNYLPENSISKISIALEDEELYSDCPIIQIYKNENIFSAKCWDWVPGPGPGDFVIDFDSEDKLIQFLIHYYFENNVYFEARKRYVIQSRRSLNIVDLKNIFDQLLQQIENKFNKSEITFFNRGTFHKIPIEKWHITESEKDKMTVEAETGFLYFEIQKLRKKIDDKEEFDQEDFTYVSDLINELSFTMKNKD
ncbi:MULTISPECIES: hypothetical protein [Chryseobacterium]|uniref:Uncharacterized protein n=1 Tax=Chryseobacterium camelliae TaxID=1265445 RepID=A0ABU0TKK6_9FLAO|nr:MULTISPECIES: hypothetical protein [Chryseobacterium]MDT3408563.1 hypothetical protein [Pseudacidovorax intermedius]MDQ1097582.1 hypothetical protein [Chryseobacterium camelliae]MDQ1101511.1 hypothetical protein [Chryseobacterium sp. SORGH_AS_1048]MDR6084954.1 hypothetical protein [Chryseobacterium sp. SORGH_AS_0909]MDR6129307.1 hypothetical protein [Chryseobacterium sp. SORGH_AS_1175]